SIESPQENEFEILTQEDIEEIQEFKKNTNNVKKALIRSFAPNIKYMDKIKEALFLTIVSGNNSNLQIRDDIHLILIGDTGTAKSKLKEKTMDICFKSRESSGGFVSKVGLICGISQNSFYNKPSLSKGLLPLSSVAFIEEFGNIPKEQINDLKQALQDQYVIYRKAGFHAKMRTDCSVVVIQNPKGGCFSNDDIKKDIDLPDPILSRFDLIFKIVDNKDFDNEIFKSMASAARGEINQKLDSEFLSKYCYHARKNFNPVVKGETEALLVRYAAKKRKKAVTGFLTRKIFNTLIRLTCANAKLRLSNKTTIQDAEESIKLIEFMHESIGIESVDELIIGPQKQVKSFLELADSFKNEEGLVNLNIIKENMNNITTYRFDEIVNDLKKDGQIFEPKKGYIKRS
ncbi:hypothetical protein GF327_05510, partial [Candidatus Woesearchaeota archaeon]|nr:hypothetical protein [Candidatus Woesearchaeota archaeon]